MSGGARPRFMVEIGGRLRGSRASLWAACAAVLAYLVLRGHPLSWLPGLPLGLLGLALLVLVPITLYALWPAALPAEAGRRLLLLSGLLAALSGLKLLLAVLAPSYGLQADYFAKPGAAGAAERSTEFLSLGATRLDRELRFRDEGFPLYFFNDNVRFNYYRPDEPDRASLPFRAHWRGLLEASEAGAYTFWLTATGPARLALDGRVALEVGGAEDSERAQVRLSLPKGPTSIDVDYLRRAGSPAELELEWDGPGTRAPLAVPFLFSEPGPLPASLWPGLLELAHGADLLFLLGLGSLVNVLVRARSAPLNRERLLLSSLLALTFAYASLSSLELHHRAVVLDGGADWLTYETYARDILENGPLMTLGRALGKGRPYYFQPFYPYALAAAHWLTGEDLYGLIVLQVFGVGLSGVLVYALGKRLFGALRGALATVMWLGLLGPLHLDWVAHHLLSENLYFLLLPGTALSLITLGRRPDRGWAALGGTLLGLACVTRAPTLFWAPIALLLTRLRIRSAFPQAARGAIAAAALSCAGVVLLVPLRNLVVSGQPAIVATNGMATMELAHPLPPGVDLRGVDRNPLYQALRLDMSIIQFAEFLRQDPGGYLATLPPLGLYALGIPGVLEEGGSPRWELLALVALYLMSFADPASRRLEAWLLHSFVAVHFLTMMVFLPNVYGYRQVLPMYVFIVVFAGQTLAHLFTRVWQVLRSPGEEPQRHPGQGRGVEQYVPGTRTAPSHEELA